MVLLASYVCCDESPPMVVTNSLNLLPHRSEGQRSGMGLSGLNQSVLRALIPSGSSRGESVFLPFPHSRDCLRSLAHGPFLRLQSWQ